LADSVGGSGRVGAVYFGTAEALVADVKGAEVASGANEIWLLSSDKDAEVVVQYRKVEVEGAPTAWVRGTHISKVASCEPS
jgi:hypothetical protein